MTVLYENVLGNLVVKLLDSKSKELVSFPNSAIDILCDPGQVT